MKRRAPCAALPPCHGAFLELSPLRLEAAAALAGAPAGPFRRVLVLECGTGVGSAILAAALAGTGASVWAATPDAEDAEIARGLAAEAGLETTILAEGLEALAARTDLPMFDLVAMPWGWDGTTAAERGALLDLLARRLAPGGGFLRGACVSAAAPEMFLRRLAANRLAAAEGPSPEARAERAAADLTRVFAQSHAMIRQMPDWELRARELAMLPPRTFLRLWGREAAPVETMRQTGVALSAAGFSGWVPADPQRLARDLDLTAAQESVSGECPDPWIAAETADLLTNRVRRMDLFLKPGGATPDPGAVRLAPAGAPAARAASVQGLLGPTTLSRRAYGPLLDLIRREGDVSLAEAAASLGDPLETVVQRAAVLAGGRLACPVAPPAAEAACARLNAVLRNRALGLWRASPAARGPVVE